MAVADLHTRMVGWLKVVLPLTALAILSTLFLLADRIDPTEAIPYAKVDVEALAADPRMTAPAYAGITSDGAGLTLSATEARPGSESVDAAAEGVSALLETPDGAKARLSAAKAVMNANAQTVALSGGVTVESTIGWQMATDALTVHLDRTLLQSQGKVEIHGPMGLITASSFSLTQTPDQPGDYVLVFKGGVKLVYQPGG